MTAFSHDRYCGEVVVQADLLNELLRCVDLSHPVPTCPGWTLEDLKQHVIGNLVTLEAAARGESPPDGPTTTLQDAAAAFARTLRAAGPNQPAEFSGITLPTAFWARRATHDLVIHRADVAYATGVDYAVDLQLAVDTIDELLENVSPARPDFEQLQGADSSIHLHATDTGEELAAEWYVESGPDGLVWGRSHQKAAVALRGPLVDVLTVFYRRQPVDGSPVEALGSRPLVDRWLDRVNLG